MLYKFWSIVIMYILFKINMSFWWILSLYKNSKEVNSPSKHPSLSIFYQLLGSDDSSFFTWIPAVFFRLFLFLISSLPYSLQASPNAAS